MVWCETKKEAQMPGFNIGQNQGQGTNGPSNLIETRRKHRWEFETIDTTVAGILIYLQKCSRPSFSLQEPVMHHDQEQAYFAGKQEWQPIDMAWYDTLGVESGGEKDDASKSLWDWLYTVVNIDTAVVALPSKYKKEATLATRNNAGAVDERWRLHGCWPKEINWGDLDYTNTEIQLVEVKMRFDRANREKA